MITGLSMINEMPKARPKAARLSAGPSRRAIADWIVGPSSIMSVNESASGSQSQKTWRRVNVVDGDGFCMRMLYRKKPHLLESVDGTCHETIEALNDD